MITKIQTPLRRSRKGQRGIILVWTMLCVVILMICSALVVDVSWLYFRRERAQGAADAAALAGDWALTQGYTDANADALANQVLQSNGYTTAGGASLTVTPHSFSTANNFTVNIGNPEPMFFGTVIGNNHQTIMASATATYSGFAPMWTDPKFYGEALSMPFVYCAYGPDQGATRGDAIDTRWTDTTGEYPKTPNPLNYNPVTGKPLDTGINYIIQPVTNYATLNPYGNSKLMVQIYDPQTSVSSSDTRPLDQYVNAADQSSSSGTSPSEKWRYTVYAQNNTTQAQTQIATAVYGESDTQLEGKWVTPPSFSFDISSYNLSNTSFILNVRTDDGSGNPGVGTDKNGYLLRAGPDYSADTTTFGTPATDSNSDQYWSPSTDSTWNSKFGSLAPLGAESNMSITACESGSGEISFGSTGTNPNASQPSIITFNGFDEDTGASGISYSVSAPNQTYDGTKFTGVLGWQAKDNNGNGIWSAAGSQTRGVSNATTPSNTVYFPPGAYQGGSWTANYATGSQDVTTWNWTVNWAANAAVGKPYLIYTQHSDY